LEQAPSADPENWQVVHTYLLAEAGISIMEIVNLEELAGEKISAIDAISASDREFFFDHDRPCRLLFPHRMCSLLSWIVSTPAHNMARYYVLSTEPTLFEDSSLIREYGRIGKPGRRRIDLHRDHNHAGIALSAWLARKVPRGYKTRPS
jgi:predicted DNA-binding WGR domain protein